MSSDAAVVPGLDEMEQSLSDEFAGRVPHDTVVAVVEAAAARYADARITQFLTVFVARDARSQLRRLTS